MHYLMYIFFSILLCSFSLSAYEFTLERAPLINKLVDFKASALCEVSENTQYYLENFTDDEFAVHPGTVFVNKVSMRNIEKTLAFICKIYREDVRAKQQSRLHDIKFIKQNLKVHIKMSS